MKTILVTGPESIGKSTLSQALSIHYDGQCIDEYARSYLETNGSAYSFSDLDKIAQIHFDKYLKANDTNLLFLDTFLLNIKIWAEFKFEKTIDFVEEKLELIDFSHILLLEPNIDWQEDQFRENKENAKLLFDKFEFYINHYNWTYTKVNKKGPQRLQQAIEIINSIL